MGLLQPQPTKAKGIEDADLVLCKFATLLPVPGGGYPTTQCRVWLVLSRNIAMAVLLLERVQLVDALFPGNQDAKLLHHPTEAKCIKAASLFLRKHAMLLGLADVDRPFA